jgi:hypothetical protein
VRTKKSSLNSHSPSDLLGDTQANEFFATKALKAVAASTTGLLITTQGQHLSTTKASSAQKEVIDRFAQAISTQSGLEANCFDSDLSLSLSLLWLMSH